MNPESRDIPSVTLAGLAEDLRGLGLAPGDTVLVHSAMSRVGLVPGGAGALRDVLLQVLGPEGTLVAPTFPFTGSLLEHLRGAPRFDVANTPSRMGALSEAIRTHPQAVRSLGPTHPVAVIGPRTEFLTAAHRDAAGPCDESSPIYRLRLVGGKVLLLGVDFRSCTVLHTAEEIARVPFIDFETRYPVVVSTPDGEYTASIYCHSAPLKPDFPAIEPELRRAGLLAVGTVGHAEARLFGAGDLLDLAVERLRRDAYFLRVRV